MSSIDVEVSEQGISPSEEIKWGFAYRERKKLDRESRKLPTKKLSLDKKCKVEKMLLRKKCPKKKKKKKKKPPPRKLTLLERSTLSQKQYMNLLAQPNRVWKPYKPKEEICPKKLPCELGPCPPRIVLMSVPNRRILWETWKNYQGVLSPETIVRIDDMLHTERNIEPQQASVYFKDIDKKKRKKRLRKKMLKLRKQMKKLKERKMWVKKEVEKVAKAIICYIKDAPYFDLNYKQLAFSDGILKRLAETKQLPLLERNTKSCYKRSLIEICDKSAVWVDALMRFVENQFIESDSDIPELEESEFGEEEYVEEEPEEEGEEEGEWEEIDEGEYEEYGEDQIFDMKDMPGIYDEYGEGDVAPFQPMDPGLLDKLIEILSSCEPDDNEHYAVEPSADLLERIKNLRGQTLYTTNRDAALEGVILEWSVKCDTDRVDDDIRQLIPIVAGLLKEEAEATGQPFGADMEGGDGGFKEPGTDGYDFSQNLEMEGQYGDFAAGQGDEVPGIDDFVQQAVDEAAAMAQYGEGMEPVSDATTADMITTTDEEGMLEKGEEGISDMEAMKAAEELDRERELEMERQRQMAQAGEEGMGYEEGLMEPQEIAVLYEKCQIPGEIKAHKPAKVLEHKPGTICCLSLKIWAVWLLEITHNAHNWTKWMGDMIRKVREFAATVRGEVKDENGDTKVLYKSEWRKFCKETKIAIKKWNDYSQHVRDLNQEISDEFRGKRVTCCPKCLQDQIIKDVVTAHSTLKALTDAMSNAAYWHCNLEDLVDQATLLAEIEEVPAEEEAAIEADVPSIVDFQELFECICHTEKPSEESVYLLEEVFPDDYQEPDESQDKKGKKSKDKKGKKEKGEKKEKKEKKDKKGKKGGKESEKTPEPKAGPSGSMPPCSPAPYPQMPYQQYPQYMQGPGQYMAQYPMGPYPPMGQYPMPPYPQMGQYPMGPPGQYQMYPPMGQPPMQMPRLSQGRVEKAPRQDETDSEEDAKPTKKPKRCPKKCGKKKKKDN